MLDDNKDLWSYGAIYHGAFYGPLEFLELDEAQEALRTMGITVHNDEFDRGDEKGFELQDGTRIDVEEFAESWAKQDVLDAIYDHVDNLADLDVWADIFLP